MAGFVAALQRPAGLTCTRAGGAMLVGTQCQGACVPRSICQQRAILRSSEAEGRRYDGFEHAIIDPKDGRTPLW